MQSHANSISFSEWHFLLLIAESFLISIGAAYFLRPSVNATFDLYPIHLEKQDHRKWRYEKTDGDAGPPSKFAPPEADETTLPMGVVGNGPVSIEYSPGKNRSEDPLFRYPKVDPRDKHEKGRPGTTAGQSFQNSEPIGITV